jgi:protein ImuA
MNQHLVRQLAQRIGEIETNERPLSRTVVPLTIPGLRDVLANRGLSAGSLVELLSGTEGAGVWTLALILGKHACTGKKILVIVDEQLSFYPPAACTLGIDLRRTLIIRPKERVNTLAAFVQSLRCAAVGAVIGSFERLNAVEYRSLQLAAETGGGVGFVMRPALVNGPCFAAVRLLVTCEGRRGEGRESRSSSPLSPFTPRPSPLLRRLQIEVLRLRGDKAGRAFVLEIDHETGDVRVPASVAVAKASARAVRSAE